MQIRKAVITAAGPGQRTLPMQLLIDQQGSECSVLSLVVREASRAGINDVCIVVSPGDFYGTRSAGFFRVAAVQPDDRIELAAQRVGA